MAKKEYMCSLEECPVPGCSREWSGNDGQDRVRHFLEDHDPEDFGLSPLGGGGG